MLIAVITIKFIGLCCEIKKAESIWVAEGGEKKEKEEMAEAEKTLEAVAEERGQIIIKLNVHCCCLAMPELCATYANERSRWIFPPEYFNILNHLAVFVDTRRSFMLSHCSKDRGNVCKWEQSLDVTQGVIAFRSRPRTHYNDVIIKNNTKQPVFGNEKSTDICSDLYFMLLLHKQDAHTQA